MTMSESPRRGTTLLEMLVTLMLLAIIASMSALAIRRIDAPMASDPQQMIADSLREATSLGKPVHVRIVRDGIPANAVGGSDGSVIADSIFKVDRLSGMPPHAQ